MLSLVLQITIASIIFICIAHYLINFFKDNLTVPKVKDLVNAPNRKYETMYDIIQQNKSSMENISTSIHSLPTTEVEQYLPTSQMNTTSLTPSLSSTPSTPSPSSLPISPEIMKDELKSFFKRQLSASSANDSFSTSNDSFSNAGLFPSY